MNKRANIHACSFTMLVCWVMMGLLAHIRVEATTPYPVQQDDGLETWSSLYGIAVDKANQYVYVTDVSDTTHLSRVRLEDGSVTKISLSLTLSQPQGLALDSTSTYAYISDPSKGHVYKVVLSTGHTSQLDQGGSYGLMVDVAVSADNSKVFVGDIFNHHVYSIAVADGTVTTVDDGTLLFAPYGLATEPTNKYVYVMDRAHIYSVALSHGATTQLDLSGSTLTSSCHALAVDSASYYAYTEDISSHIVYRLKISSGFVDTLYSGAPLSQVYCMAIPTDNSLIYMSDQGAKHVFSLALDLPPTCDATTIPAPTNGNTGNCTSPTLASSSSCAVQCNSPYALTVAESNVYNCLGATSIHLQLHASCRSLKWTQTIC